MARRCCLYCKEDVGEALPRDAWAMYSPDVQTSCVCDKPACQAEHMRVMAPYAAEVQ